MDALKKVKSVFVKQTIEWVDMISGYETPNRYQVYYKNPDDKKYTMLFSGKEMSGYFFRNCCVGETRPFIMNLKHVSNNRRNLTDFTRDNFASFSKPFQLSGCFCSVKMSSKYFQGLPFGSIIQEWSLCDPVIKVLNTSGEIVYTVTTDCCKCSYFFRGSCGMFKPVTFYIFSGKYGNSKKSNLASGKIEKNIMGIQSFISDSDNFEILFPPEATEEDKMNLIGVGLMIDYIYFEENPNSV